MYRAIHDLGINKIIKNKKMVCIDLWWQTK